MFFCLNEFYLFSISIVDQGIFFLLWGLILCCRCQAVGIHFLLPLSAGIYRKGNEEAH